ncbi:hypothetical protein [Streptomyces sp. NPDC088785]|uniref:hypothetical protein n=1 Tax=Streptomyces sp. NPDC088785 TaxID=3365897 RepID=UPI0037FF201F
MGLGVGVGFWVGLGAGFGVGFDDGVGVGFDAGLLGVGVWVFGRAGVWVGACLVGWAGV